MRTIIPLLLGLLTANFANAQEIDHDASMLGFADWRASIETQDVLIAGFDVVVDAALAKFGNELFDSACCRRTVSTPPPIPKRASSWTGSKPAVVAHISRPEC